MASGKGTSGRHTSRGVAVHEAAVRRLLEGLPFMVLALDRAGRPAAWNGECRRVTGRSLEELQSDGWRALFPEAAARRRWQRELAQRRTRRFRDWQWQVTTRTGERRILAWTRVAELAPDKPDGPLNRARAEIAEGRLADASASLALAEKIRPGWEKTAFFRSIVARDEGRLDDAERDLRAVLAKFPLDRVAWNNLGGVLWLGGRFPEAAQAYGKTLAIDPEDLTAHYNLMRVYRALGNRQLAAVHAAAYRKFKEDETGRAVAADLRRQDVWANRESLPIHVHEEASPPPATPPAWVASLGPKGYQTDLGYLTRAHAPIRREVAEPAGVPPAKSTSYAPASVAPNSGSK